ncbi:MAG TPA: amidohydrolase family protein [Xanthobacteraceae bacterium]|nr:amidohydrolase family protein [Xanthobacteraceae bacterium]
MTTRRNFLGGAGALGGLMFCGCGWPMAAHAQSAPARLPVTIKGKRLKTIDVHAHCFFKAAIDAAGETLDTVQPPGVLGIPQLIFTPEERLKEMDAMAIDMEILSINPWWYRKEREVAETITNLQNEKLAELTALKPDRFAAFASLALQYPDLAAQQLETAVKKQGLKGAAIGGTVLGEDFSAPRFHPVWQKAEELGAVLFIHPQTQPQLSGRYKGNGWLSNTIGNPLDTTIALAKLIFEGTLDRFPGLKVLAAHGGGYLPSYADRSDHACFVAPANCDPAIKLKKTPTEYLRQLYFDALVFTPEALRHLAAQVGASQLMVGSDHPFPWEQHPVDHILGSPLSDDDKVAILSENAAKLFGIKINGAG